MQKLTRNEEERLIQAILNKDQKSFEIFYKQFDNAVYDIVRKWYRSIEIYSLGLYDIDDVHSEAWEHILRLLPTYDSEKAGVITWLYLIVNDRLGKLLREYKAVKRSPVKNGIHISSVDEVAFDDGKDNSQIHVLDLLFDPQDNLEDKIMTEQEIYTYIAILKKIIKIINHKSRMVYIHSIKGLTQTESGNIIGVSQVQVSRTLKRVRDKILNEWTSFEFNNSIFNEIMTFVKLLLSSKTDDEIVEEINEELGVIKICREALFLTNLYERR